MTTAHAGLGTAPPDPSVVAVPGERHQLVPPLPDQSGFWSPLRRPEGHPMQGYTMSRHQMRDERVVLT
jgi:hypothetical protein